MGTLSLALALSLVNSVGASPDAPIAMNERAIKIPYNLTAPQSDVSDVILYVSIDQGKVWSRAGMIKPTEKYFPFQAPTDGQYWFNVAVAYRNGAQVPADISQSPPQQKLIIDTQKPVVHINSAERIGEEISVNWEIQEPNADLGSFKVEYRPTDAGAGGFWVTASTSPGLVGQAKFRANTVGSVTVRVSMQDTATNLGWAEKVVGTSPSVAGVQPTNTITPVAAPSSPPTGVLPVTNNNQSEPQPVAIPAPVMPVPTAPVSPPVNEPAPLIAPVATSNRTTTPAPSATYTTLRAEQPEMHHTNEPQVTVDYEVDHGPSGVSKVEVYLTQDDGRTWVKWQDLTRNDLGRVEQGQPATPSNKLPVTVRMPDREGQFGFRLVPFSGAQISNGAPQAGAEPEFRIQYDRTQPYVELFKPEGDNTQKNVLVLQWKATDLNFGATPIRIYWSENGTSDWHAVNAGSMPGTDAGGLPNTGKYNWEVPTGLPLKVFLKITAEDKAGNIGEAITGQPLVVDLHKPVGRFKGIIDTKRRN